ncbi:hypothetical protein [Streptosporangium sp. NPDC000396]|uniref:hypothetical protein n=1 Tax=Streptosporangium sp. NPDC000396 TaxID=3366185 RepID=UPI0036C91888
MTSEKTGIGRITAAAVAIAAMLPYLTLKTLWLTGRPIGVTDPGLMNSSTMFGLNAMTWGMDAVGLMLALAFTMRWGMRLPAWLVLLPLWVGGGLLSVILLTVPISLFIVGPGVFSVGGPIQSWVYMAVYGGFIGQGIGLLAAFALYARDRWPAVLTTPLGRGSIGATRPFQTVVARGALLMTVLIGAVRLYWSLGGTAGLPAALAADHSVVGRLQDGCKGLLAIAAGVALMMMVRGRGHRPLWQPLAVAWIGAGAMFGWGLYALIILSVGGPLAAGPLAPGVNLVELFSTLTGLVMGMCGAFLLTERSGVRPPRPARGPDEVAADEDDRETAHQSPR